MTRRDARVSGRAVVSGEVLAVLVGPLVVAPLTERTAAAIRDALAAAVKPARRRGGRGR